MCLLTLLLTIPYPMFLTNTQRLQHAVRPQGLQDSKSNIFTTSSRSQQRPQGLQHSSSTTSTTSSRSQRHTPQPTHPGLGIQGGLPIAQVCLVPQKLLNLTIHLTMYNFSCLLTPSLAVQDKQTNSMVQEKMPPVFPRVWSHWGRGHTSLQRERLKINSLWSLRTTVTEVPQYVTSYPQLTVSFTYPHKIKIFNLSQSPAHILPTP